MIIIFIVIHRWWTVFIETTFYSRQLLIKSSGITGVEAENSELKTWANQNKAMFLKLWWTDPLIWIDILPISDLYNKVSIGTNNNPV